MKKLNKNESGFGAVEGLLILVLVVLIAVVGWYVWHSKKASNSSYNNAGSASTVTKPAAKPKSTPTTANVTQKVPSTTTNQRIGYLVIKEWGVEIPLTTDIKDAYYTTLKVNSFRDPVYAIGTKTLTTLDANCAPENHSVSFILKQTISEHDANAKMDDPLNNPVYDTKIGSYYYGYDRSRAACSTNQKTNDLQIATFNSLEEAFKGLKAVN